MRPPLINGTIVTLSASADLLRMQTFSRKFGRSPRFLVNRETFENWLENPSGNAYHDRDIFSFVSIARCENVLRLEFTWLHGMGESIVKGHTESVTVPSSTITDVLRSKVDTEFKCISVPNTRQQTKLDFSQAQRRLHEAVGEPLTRRALSKALRAAFQGYEKVSFYNDFACSFGFREMGGWGINGGLILHQTNEKTEHGTFPKLYYGVHT